MGNVREGLLISDLEECKRYSLQVMQNVDEVVAEVSAFIGSTKELENLGKNVEKLAPIMEQLSGEVDRISDISFTSLKAFNKMCNEMDDAQNVNFDLEN